MSGFQLFSFYLPAFSISDSQRFSIYRANEIDGRIARANQAVCVSGHPVLCEAAERTRRSAGAGETVAALGNVSRCAFPGGVTSALRRRVLLKARWPPPRGGRIAVMARAVTRRLCYSRRTDRYPTARDG